MYVKEREQRERGSEKKKVVYMWGERKRDSLLVYMIHYCTDARHFSVEQIWFSFSFSKEIKTVMHGESLYSHVHIHMRLYRYIHP